MAKDKSPEVTIQLVNDWYGPDGKFRRVSDNPHTVSGAAAEQIPSSALVEEDGKFKKQPKRAPKVIEDETPDDEEFLSDDRARSVRGMTAAQEASAEKKAAEEKKAAADAKAAAAKTTI